MNRIRITDITMKQEGLSLSFKEKLELSKLLDKLGVSAIELPAVQNAKTDSLLIKSIAASVSCAICVPVSLELQDLDTVYAALKTAKTPILQICASVSTVQMEYLYHKKPEKMLSAIENAVKGCKEKCDRVEFVADDATRSDPAFLLSALETALSAGATTVTVRDAAGDLLPEEFAAFVANIRKALPDANLGVSCNNALSLADACAIAAMANGASELKAAAYPICAPAIAHIAKILSVKADTLSCACPVGTTELSRLCDQIARLCRTEKVRAAALPPLPPHAEELTLTARDDMAAVMQATGKLGYDLSPEDAASVFAAFRDIAAKKAEVSAKELDAIVATAAMQVPATYTLDNYVITAASATSATAHMKLSREGKTLEGVSLGDGAIDAAFHALEQITGCHFELDDFRIEAVTEGREAMGQTIVKLRAGGKVYSGRGISTDIIGASIHAYLNALNKIVYEEETV